MARTPSKFSQTLAALRAGESASWELAYALKAEVAPGMVKAREQDFGPVLAAIKAAGFERSYQTVRQYRLVGVFWPEADRVPGVSFSAHKEAMAGAKDSKSAARLIREVIASNGGGAKGKAATTQSAVKAKVAAVNATRKAKGRGGRKAATPKATVAQASVAKGTKPADYLRALSGLVNGLTVAWLGQPEVSNDHLLDLEAMLTKGAASVRAEIDRRIAEHNKASQPVRTVSDGKAATPETVNKAKSASNGKPASKGKVPVSLRG